MTLRDPDRRSNSHGSRSGLRSVARQALRAVVLVLVAAGPAGAVPFLVDQSNLPPSLSGINYRNIHLAQSFTPTFGALDVVELRLALGPALLRVDIRRDGVTGPVRGSSADVLVQTPETFPGQVFQFLFDSPIPLVPGNLYVIDLVFISGVGGFSTIGPDTYAGGQAFADGSSHVVGWPDGAADLWFQTGWTGAPVPEPGTAWLVTSGMAALSIWRAHRSRSRAA